MIRRWTVRLPLCVGAVALATLITAACAASEPEGPPQAAPGVTLSHERVPAGSALEITYTFVVAADARFTEDYRVFAHVVDADEERMWDDDHDPPTPTTRWQPGQTIEYTRTIFVPVFPYVGDATITVGLYSLRDQTRIVLSGEDVGQRAYRVARLQLLPQTENLFTVFKEGWHPAEVAQVDATVEWQWTKKEATLAFKNPRKDALLYLDLDSPNPELHGEQQVQVIVGGQTVDQFTLRPADRLLRKIALPASAIGTPDMGELHIVVDKAFVPAEVSGGASRDPRELGVRVFHAFVDGR